MDDFKGTPGPWSWSRGEDDANGFARIAIETSPDAGDIAGIHHADRGTDEANARLIAAAPTLLAVAWRCLNHFAGEPDDGGPSLDGDLAAAIYKATGRPVG
jgi:hypothetical protein